MIFELAVVRRHRHAAAKSLKRQREMKNFKEIVCDYVMCLEEPYFHRLVDVEAHTLNQNSLPRDSKGSETDQI